MSFNRRGRRYKSFFACVDEMVEDDFPTMDEAEVLDWVEEAMPELEECAEPDSEAEVMEWYNALPDDHLLRNPKRRR